MTVVKYEDLAPYQKAVVDRAVQTVNIDLQAWGRQLGKTTVRKIIAQRILEEDR